jgi:hypothetical protein
MKYTIIYSILHEETDSIICPLGYNSCPVTKKQQQKSKNKQLLEVLQPGWKPGSKSPDPGTVVGGGGAHQDSLSPICLPSVEDLERNDGSVDRPYYMPTSLLKILGKKNEALPGNKKRKK